MEGRKWIKRNLDRILKMLLSGRKERKKEGKVEGKNICGAHYFFILSKLEGKLFSTYFNVKLPCYPHF